jgi:hypothetical protein
LSDAAQEALHRARIHLQRASLEGLEAARALVQAGMHTSGLTSATGDSWVGNVQRSLEELIAELRENGSFILPSAIAEPLAKALEVEIKRWELRSLTDSDARVVLRAFLGLRELLWELGMRHGTSPTSDRAPSHPGPRETARPQRDRVQRFNVED